MKEESTLETLRQIRELIEEGLKKEPSSEVSKIKEVELIKAKGNERTA